jgi:hypothetical protein
MDMATYKYDKGDISVAANIVAKFEENVKKAQATLETATDESMFEEWKMVAGGSDPIFRQCHAYRWFVVFCLITYTIIVANW